MASDEGNDGPSNFTVEITYVIALFCTSIVRGDNGLQCLLNTIATVCTSFKSGASRLVEAQAASESMVIHTNEESIQWTGAISMEILGRYAYESRSFHFLFSFLFSGIQHDCTV